MYYAFLIMLVYGLLSPIYFRLLKGKLSNEKGFYVVWVTAPFLASYFYLSSSILYVPLIAINTLGYYLVYKGITSHISDGLLFLLTSVIIMLFYKL
ncbi:MAG: hypothetical protein K1T65_01090 [Candidatus Aramenus sp.]|nr:hypothetical protein [Candidatus Aramenus sp.]